MTIEIGPNLTHLLLAILAILSGIWAVKYTGLGSKEKKGDGDHGRKENDE